MRINAILIPLISSEICSLKTWLRYCPPSGKQGRKLFLSIDLSWDDSSMAEIKDTFSRCPLSHEGWQVEFIDCGMKPDASFYVKDSQQQVDLEEYPYGQKSGPNMQFFRSIRALRDYADELGSVLLLEVDAFPVVDGWMAKMDDSLRGAPNDALVAGGRYAGESRLTDQIVTHLNGNGVYFVARTDFFSFLDCWEALLLRGNKIVPWLAYDVVIPWFLNYRHTHARVRTLEDDQTDYLESCYNKRFFNLSNCLINYGGDAENDKGYSLDVNRFLNKHPDALVIHGKCFNYTIFRIRAAKRSSGRRHLLNVMHDLILNGSYDEAILFGVGNFEILRLIAARVDMLTNDQLELIQRGWR